MKQASLRHHDVAHLENICSMDVIVILDFSTVTLKYLTQESRQHLFVEIWVLVELQLLQNVNRKDRQSRFAANLLDEAMDVEVNLLDIFQVLVEVANKVHNSVDAGSATDLLQVRT